MVISKFVEYSNKWCFSREMGLLHWVSYSVDNHSSRRRL